jgi:internalin A
MPETGTMWEIGTTVEINWQSTSSDKSDLVNIDLMQESKLSTQIVKNTPNDGSHHWNIPENTPFGDNFRIKMYSSENGSNEMISDGNFVLYKYIDIPNSSLRTQILETLELGNNSRISTWDLSKIDELSISDISDLQGLEYCTNLIVLSLSDSNLESINEIKDLNELINIYFTNVIVPDYSPIQELSQLTFVNMKQCELGTLDYFSESYNLFGLVVDYDTIKDLAPIKGLANLSLLKLAFNSLTDLDGISSLTNLKKVILNNNSLNDISDLHTLKQVNFLDLAWNNITNTDALKNITSLDTLDLSHNSYVSILPLIDNHGFASGDVLYILGNWFSGDDSTIITLQNRGVAVYY